MVQSAFFFLSVGLPVMYFLLCFWLFLTYLRPIAVFLFCFVFVFVFSCQPFKILMICIFHLNTLAPIFFFFCQLPNHSHVAIVFFSLFAFCVVWIIFFIFFSCFFRAHLCICVWGGGEINAHHYFSYMSCDLLSFFAS